MPFITVIFFRKSFPVFKHQAINIKKKTTLVPEAIFYSLLANFATRTASYIFLLARRAERREKKASGRDRWEPHFHAISF